MNPLILFEDEHLLAVNKPSGINTHKPDRFAPDGIHEWLKKREARWRDLSVLHRLDKDTSGVIVFGKTRQANQSLAKQFESHRVTKKYLLLCSARPARRKMRVQSNDAVAEFELLRDHGELFLVSAQPVTGKTHQVRRHAAENGFAIVGDREYGGIDASRLMLHAHTISFEHPASDQRITVEAPMPSAFSQCTNRDACSAVELAMVTAQEFGKLLFASNEDSAETNAFRMISGAADGFEAVTVDSYAGNLLIQWQTEETERSCRVDLLRRLKELSDSTGRGACATISEQWTMKHKRTAPVMVWSREGRGAAGGAQLPRFLIRENGLKFWVNFGEGFSTGIFLDQRENRRKLLGMNLAGKTVLNCFAYTCAFSVASAKAGATVTSLDLSKQYLEWGRENFRANELEPEGHDFIYGDVFDWLKRFEKRGRKWDMVLLDPPTFSTTKKGRVFRAASDYKELAALAMPLLAKGGVLFCSTNNRKLGPERFEGILMEAVRQAGRRVEGTEFETLPFDFRCSIDTKPYLKTFWFRIV